MARKPRVHVPGGVYHVILKGNGGQSIFDDDADRSRLCLLLQEGVMRFGHRIHAFCFMTNHLHLAIQVGETPLSKIVQNVAFRYTRWINKRRKQVGHLFQGRYKAILVDADSYLLELVRYIHLNAVTAGLVGHPEAYSWSGHNTYLGTAITPWLTTDWVLSQFGRQRNAAQRKYGEFIHRGLKTGVMEPVPIGRADSRILGDDAFVDTVLSESGKAIAKRPSAESIIGAVCAHYGVEEASLCGPSRQRHLAEARGVTAWLVTEYRSESITKLAARFGRDVSALSLAIRKIEERSRLSDSFRQWLKGIENDLITQ